MWRAAAGRRVEWRALVIVSAVAIAAWCAFRIIRRNRDWHDDVKFYKATLALQPDAYIMHINLAGGFIRPGRSHECGAGIARSREDCTGLSLNSG